MEEFVKFAVEHISDQALISIEKLEASRLSPAAKRLIRKRMFQNIVNLFSVFSIVPKDGALEPIAEKLGLNFDQAMAEISNGSDKRGSCGGNDKEELSDELVSQFATFSLNPSSVNHPS